MSRKAEIKASLRGIARALHNFMGTGSEERLPEKLVTLSERLTKSSHHQDDPRMEPAIGRVQMSQKLAKSAAELESMIMAELREHPECDSAAVEVTSKEIGWDAVLVRAGTQLNDPCEAMLVEITERLRREFDLSE
jgi:hypothetical protein